MSGRWIYKGGESTGNDYEMGCPENWQRAKGGGGYRPGRDFFWVHWQVNTSKPGQASKPEDRRIVRLHVESPRYAEDSSLNDLKREVIAALLASNVSQVARQKGYHYEVGVKTAIDQIQQNKSTEAFRVVLDDSQSKPTNEENIKTVHAAIGTEVDAVLQRFDGRLKQQFP